MFHVQISTCDLCQRNSQKLSIATPELFPVSVHSSWHHVGIDFVALFHLVNPPGEILIHSYPIFGPGADIIWHGVTKYGNHISVR